PVPIRQHPKESDKGWIAVSSGHDPLDPVRPPQVVMDFIYGREVQAGLRVDDGVGEVAVVGLVQGDDAEDVRRVTRVGHEVAIPMPCDKAGNDTPWLPSPHGPLRQRLLPHPRGWAADSGWIGALLVGDREALTRHRTTGAVT